MREGFDPSGNATLSLKVRSGGPLQAAVAAAQAELRERLRADVLSEVERSEEYQRLAELRPVYRKALRAAQGAEAKASPLRGKKAELQKAFPVPKNLGERLVKLGAELEAAEGELRQRQAELAELRPVYDQAAQQVRGLVRQACQRADAEARRRESEAVKEGLAGFARDCSERLTGLFVLARRGNGLARPNAEKLAALVIDSPGAA